MSFKGFALPQPEKVLASVTSSKAVETNDRF